jgi:Domain of unknown function (DUF4249)
VNRRVVAACAVVVCASACELESTTAPGVEPRAVVHAVINPAGTQQIVIVERTLRSAVTSAGQSTGREPITNARVVIYGPRADSAIAVQSAGASDGVYRVTSVTITNGSPGTAPPNVLRVRPGERYTLRVETPLGVVAGETTVPVAGPIDGVRRTFNVDRDTLRVDLSAVRNVAGYLLRHERSGGAAERFTTSIDDGVLLFPLARAAGDPEDEKWAFSFARQLLYPGVPQTVAVVAVDSNYFHYYVAGFDPFGDDTRGNTLTGGVGLFGSVATVMSKTLDLVADIDTPIEGTWTGDRNSATLPLTMTLYSSPFFPDPPFQTAVVVSGTGRTFAGRVLQAFGSLSGNGVGFNFVDPNGPAELSNATGLLSADALVLTDSRTGERVTYRKR